MAYFKRDRFSGIAPESPQDFLQSSLLKQLKTLISSPVGLTPLPLTQTRLLLPIALDVLFSSIEIPTGCSGTTTMCSQSKAQSLLTH